MNSETLVESEPLRHLDESWFWPVLAAYRDDAGRTLQEAERAWIQCSEQPPEVVHRFVTEHQWRFSPKSERSTSHLVSLIEQHRDPSDPFTYLEFGTCFGTTMATVLRHFPCARGIGLEMNPSRYAVTRWLTERMRSEFHLDGRIDLKPVRLREAGLSPNSVDVVLMNTDHRYPDDYDCICYLIDENILKDGFLFIGDDPFRTGTKLARERFTQENDGFYRIETRQDWNLWWFQATWSSAGEARTRDRETSPAPA